MFIDIYNCFRGTIQCAESIYLKTAFPQYKSNEIFQEIINELKAIMTLSCILSPFDLFMATILS